MTRPCVTSASAALCLYLFLAGCTSQEHGTGGQGGTDHTQHTGGSPTSTGGRSNGGAGASSSGGSTSTTGGGSAGTTAGSGGAGGGASGGHSGHHGDAGAGATGGAGVGDAVSSTPEVPAAAIPKLSTDVLPIVKANCARAGCHDPVKKEHGMDLSTAATIHAGWVNRKTADHCMNNASVTRVTPGKPESSFVVTLAKNLADRCAEVRRMPPAPLPPLSAADVRTISDWITAGALND